VVVNPLTDPISFRETVAQLTPRRRFVIQGLVPIENADLRVSLGGDLRSDELRDGIARLAAGPRFCENACPYGLRGFLVRLLVTLFPVLVGTDDFWRRNFIQSFGFFDGAGLGSGTRIFCGPLRSSCLG
jgi:hypothetical protein